MFPTLPTSQIVTSADSGEASLLQSEGDFGIINRLLKNPRYNIPEHLRSKAVASIEATFDDPENNTAIKLKAVQCLAMLDKHNIDLVKMAIPKKIEYITPSKMSDEELHEEIRNIAQCLPKPIDAKFTLKTTDLITSNQKSP